MGDPTSIARATARPFARAVAEASVNGFDEYEEDCYAEAHLRAVAAGEAWLEEYTYLLVGAASCVPCDDLAESWAIVREQIFLRALDLAEGKVRLFWTSFLGLKFHLKSSFTFEFEELGGVACSGTVDRCVQRHKHGVDDVLLPFHVVPVWLHA